MMLRHLLKQIADIAAQGLRDLLQALDRGVLRGILQARGCRPADTSLCGVAGNNNHK